MKKLAKLLKLNKRGDTSLIFVSICLLIITAIFVNLENLQKTFTLNNFISIAEESIKGAHLENLELTRLRDGEFGNLTLYWSPYIQTNHGFNTDAPVRKNQFSAQIRNIAEAKMDMIIESSRVIHNYQIEQMSTKFVYSWKGAGERDNVAVPQIITKYRIRYTINAEFDTNESYEYQYDDDLDGNSTVEIIPGNSNDNLSTIVIYGQVRTTYDYGEWISYDGAVDPSGYN